MPVICLNCFDVKGELLEFTDLSKLCPRCGNHFTLVEGHGIESSLKKVKAKKEDEAVEPEIVEPEAVEDQSEPEEEPLENYTVSELRAKAKDLEIPGAWKMTKKKLIKAIVKKA